MLPKDHTLAVNYIFRHVFSIKDKTIKLINVPKIVQHWYHIRFLTHLYHVLIPYYLSFYRSIMNSTLFSMPNLPVILVYTMHITIKQNRIPFLDESLRFGFKIHISRGIPSKSNYMFKITLEILNLRRKNEKFQTDNLSITLLVFI